MSRIWWLSALALAGAVHAGEPVQVTLDVPGMDCSLCPITVARLLRRQPGVSEASASLESKSATVTFDPGKTSARQLAQAVSDAGYPATPRSR